MKYPESHLAYLAEQPLDEDASWQEAPWLGRAALRHLQGRNPTRTEACYRFDGADALLCGASEQPDLTGPVLLEMSVCKARWVEDREKARSYQYTLNGPRIMGRYVAFHVEHDQTGERLLQAALPLSRSVATALRYGYSTRSSTPTHAACGVLRQYNDGDLAFNPRRLQAAAGLLQYAAAQRVPRCSRFNSQELAAFREEHFVRKAVPITGGGGKTSMQWVYRR